ncbi:MAG: hypothetical protein LC802_08930 [Acidobacteria bacterium]|nr:hypothetical protein [Acidobacteriota bacterium]
MGDWIGLGLIVLVLVGAVVGLSQLGKKPEPLSAEEFERRVQEGPGGLSASVIGLQKILDPGTERAVAVQQDLRAGYYNENEHADGDDDGDGSDDSPETELKRTDEEGNDA